MQHRLLRIQSSKILLALVALAFYTGAAQAYTKVLQVSPATFALTCSTSTGPGSQVVTIKLATKPSANVAVSLPTSIPQGITITPPGPLNLTSTNYSTGVTFTVAINATAGCATIPQGANATPAVAFQVGANADNGFSVTGMTTDSTVSGLLLSPNPVTVLCKLVSTTYTPLPAQTISITSSAAAAGGSTPYTLTTSSVPGWLSLSPSASSITGTANGTASTFTIQAAAGCNSLLAGASSKTTLTFTNAPAPAQTLPVTLQIVGGSPLVATPNPASGALTYIKGSGTPGYVDVAVTAPGVSPAPFFSVDTSTLPIWLNVDSTTGTAPKSIRFSSTSIADTLPPGNYSVKVNLNVSGAAPLPVSLSMLVTNPTPKLTIKEGTTITTTWYLGSQMPTSALTLVSSDSPISYNLASGGALAPNFGTEGQGLAYSFGTVIPVSFNPSVFAAAAPGSTLTGTVTVTWGSNPVSTTVVTFIVSVASPGATLTGIQPSSIPTVAPGGGPISVYLSGTGFVPGTDPTTRTKVGIVANGVFNIDGAIAVTVQNTTTIQLGITVPTSADALLPFDPTGVGGLVILGVCNPDPVTKTCTVATGTTQTLTIGSSPIITAITSASTFNEVTGSTIQSVAPYDLISIFGANFCPPCASNTAMNNAPSASTQIYPTTISPDPTGPTQRNLQVNFYTHGATHDGTTLLGTAPILFASNSQINAVVPAAVAGTAGANIGGYVDVVVSFGYGSVTNKDTGGNYTLKTNLAAPAELTIVATDPGVFAVGADGQGDGAILNGSYALINQSNPAAMRSSAPGTTDSDTVQIYMTGLGIPETGISNTVGGALQYPRDCVSLASFETALGQSAGTTITAVDGAIMQSSIINSTLYPPCVAAPTVNIGSQPATVSYAGWVSNSVAGLYQVNVQLPASVLSGGQFIDAAGTTHSSITKAVQLPVSVVTATGQSQNNVTIWVQPQLKVAAPDNLSGNIGAPWPTCNVVASEGSPTYQYLVSAGVLPSGLNMDSAGHITGVPALNTSGSNVITVTAMDSASPAVTGTVTFTLTVNGGLSLTSNPTTPTVATAGTANANIATVTASGGNGHYTYSITTGSLPVGLGIDGSTGIISTTASTPQWGPTSVTVHAVDTSSPNPLVGNITFTIQIQAGAALTMSDPGNLSAVAGTAVTTLGTVTASGGTSTYGYTMAPTAGGNLPTGLTIDQNTGVISTTVLTPVMAQTSFTVTATDSTSGTKRTGTRAVLITITQGVLTLSSPGPLVTTASGAPATLGQVTVLSGGNPSYTYSLARTDGLPYDSNLSIDPSNGQIKTANGVATMPATGFTVTVTDSTTVAPRQGLVSFTIEIDN